MCDVTDIVLVRKLNRIYKHVVGDDNKKETLMHDFRVLVAKCRYKFQVSAKASSSEPSRF